MALYKTVFGVKHKNESVRAASRSGGFFTAASDAVLDAGGIVYGVALDERFRAVHRRAETKAERDLFRGSKYVQDDVGLIFEQVEEDLKNGLTVLFSGVPCQNDGLLNYLRLKNADTKNLITLEILCHGAPSPKVWQDFLNTKYEFDAIEKVDFRDKKNFGWRDHVETVTVNGEEISSKEYTGLFYSHVMLRQSCFHCYYKRPERVSDITIGDFWRIENNDKAFDDDKGVSLVLVNTDKGNQLFQSCKKDLIIREYPFATCVQPALDHNYNEPSDRKAFWAEYTGDNVLQLAEKYSRTAQHKAERKWLSIAKKIIKKPLKVILSKQR